MRVPRVPVALMRAVVRRGVRPVLSPRFGVGFQRRWLEVVTRPTPLPRGTRVSRDRLAGRPVERITPPGGDQGRTVLYLHGGGFTVGSPATHRALAAHLAAGSGATVHVLDYRLAPEHPHPAALEDTTAAYRELLDRGVRPENIAVVGDSAGGWLALSAAISLRDQGTALPATVVLISPWLDLSLTDPGTHADRDDPMLQVSWLRYCGSSFAPGQELDSPALAPLRADLSGLPPLYVHVGGDEILLSDSVRLAERARSAGVRIELRRLDGLWHCVHAHAGLVSVATDAVTDLGIHVARSTRGVPPTNSSDAEHGRR